MAEMDFHRPVVMGAGGMASTGHALASGAAIDVLKSGGNAFDAALCASGVLSVVKSYHGGVGGDAFGIFYSAKEKRVLVLNGSGRSPKLLRRERYGSDIPERGILAACTPGLVDAWSEAASRLASRKLGELLAPAMAYAEDGFPVFPHLRNVIQANAKTLGSDAAWTKIFLPHGSLPELGDLLVQKDLARTLSAIGRGGREAFYSGEIAGLIVGESQRRGGDFSLADFAEHRSRWEEPLWTEYRGHEVFVPPPNSYGLLLLLQLKLLDRRPAGAVTGEAVAAQVRAHEAAWREGEPWVAEPGRRAELDEFVKKFPGAAPANQSPMPPRAGRDTTYIAVADRFGNWASFIQSVHMSFGCGVVVDGTGIVLNNRTPGFNLVPGHANELAPGKLPAHTLTPALVLKDRNPVLAIGTPGGLGQTQFLAQTLAHIFDSGVNLQQAIEAPRWQSEAAGGVELESRFSDAVRAQLSAAGYEVKIRGPWEFAFGGVEAIARNETGVFMGAADPRRDGYAIGY
jgi:gamma-glutamyltranspeptidase / glutathione hydrolase